MCADKGLSEKGVSSFSKISLCNGYLARYTSLLLVIRLLLNAIVHER